MPNILILSLDEDHKWAKRPIDYAAYNNSECGVSDKKSARFWEPGQFFLQYNSTKQTLLQQPKN